MAKDNKFFEDFMKLTSSAVDTAFNSVSDMKAQFDDMVSAKLNSVLTAKNFVSREEFDVVKAMAEKARLENEKLDKKIKILEKKLKSDAK